MSEHRSEKHAPSPWQVPVALDDVAEAGQHFDLAADQDVRAAIAKVVGLRDLPRLKAKFDVTRRGATGLHVAGHVSATVGQNCVVTLEPLTNEVDEDIDLEFAPPRPVLRKGPGEEAAEDVKKPSSAEVWKEPEPLVGGGVDLGALAVEFLILGLDPYPRKPGAVFQPPQDLKREEGPFAALANLTKGRDGH
jgi:hypothetical protein